MQLDKLIQLIESPIFIKQRLQLLDINSIYHIYLLQTLYGILMLLPQSHSYKLLSERLATASTLHAHISGSRGIHNLPYSTGIAGTGGSDVKRSSSPSPVPTPAINMTSSSTLSALFSHTSSRFPAPNIPSSSSTSPAATGTAATTAPTTTTGTSKALVAAVSIESLVQEFVTVQQTHSQHRKALLREKSLLFAPSSSSSSAAYNPYDSITKLSSTDAATTSSLPPLHTTDSSAPTTTTTATANVYKPSNIRSPTPPVDDTTGSLFDKPPLPPGTTSAITAFGFAESDGVPMGGNVGPTGPASGVGSVSGSGGIGKSRSSDALSAAGAGVVADGADKGQKDSSFISL